MKSLNVNRRKKVVIRKYVSKKTGKVKTYKYEYYQYKVKKKHHPKRCKYQQKKAP